MSATTDTPQTFTAVCKLRWLPKQNSEQMIIQNVEAIRIMTAGILQGEDDAAAESAERILHKELKEYLQGVKQTISLVPSGRGLGDLGGVL